MRYLETDTAKRISKIGLGTWQFGSSQWGYGEEYANVSAAAIVRRAVDLGISLFDTAEIYASGRSERILGNALAGDRENVFLADKIFPLTPNGPLVKQRARASAARLGSSRLDLYQVQYANPLGDDVALMKDIRSLRESGLVDEVGVSGYSVARWRSAEIALGSRILSNQVRYSLADRRAEDDVLPFAEANGRVIIAFSPLAQGLLSGRYHGHSTPTDRVRETSAHFRPDTFARSNRLIEVLREIGSAHAATPAQIALAWTIRHPSVAAIPGASSVEQLESNAAAAEIDLSGDEDQALRAASDWSRGPAALPSPVRVDLMALKHGARAGPRLAKMLWRDLRQRGGA
jgi:aryl-alcohol dehydrogenase-like predicted oxidoreductase